MERTEKCCLIYGYNKAVLLKKNVITIFMFQGTINKAISMYCSFHINVAIFDYLRHIK